jgi:tripartite-type tricarboxylate transporter receptor subunit TctC
VLKALLLGATLAGPMAGPTAARAQAGFPSRPLRIVTNEAGAGLDITARLIAQGLTPVLGQQVIVENRGGGGGIIAAEVAARATPDGYTLLWHNNVVWTQPLLNRAAHAPLRDLAPLTLGLTTPNLLVVPPTVPVRTTGELLALARARPGTLNVASGGNGSPTHLAAELFRRTAGIDVVHVPYKGSGPAITALMAGEAQFMLCVAQAGLRVLAVSSDKPSALLPGVPTIAESGVPGYRAAALQGMFVPAKTPAPLLARLYRETVAVMTRPDSRDRFLALGSEVVAGTPGEFAAVIRDDTTRLARLIREAGIKAD